MRVSVKMLFSQTDELSQLDHSLILLARFNYWEIAKYFANELCNPHAGVQGSLGSLKNYLYIAPETAQFFPCHGPEVLIMDENISSIRIQKPCQTAGQSRLAATALSDKSNGLSGGQVE
jgi:hypothetical protein